MPVRDFSFARRLAEVGLPRMAHADRDHERVNCDCDAALHARSP
jgi:hypothetical protein